MRQVDGGKEVWLTPGGLTGGKESAKERATPARGRATGRP